MEAVRTVVIFLKGSGLKVLGIGNAYLDGSYMHVLI